MNNTFSYIYPKDKYYPVLKKEKRPTEKKNSSEAPEPGKTAYLTFDDGPSTQTRQVLDVLKRYNIKATFFVIGRETMFGRSMYKRIIEEGHQIGNHSYSHNYSSIYRSVQSFIHDFERLEQLLHSTTGVKTNLIRYPGGSNNTISHRFGGPGIMPQIISQLTSRGYVHCDWNVDAGDATMAINNPGLITENVLKQSVGKANAVILLHDASYQKFTPGVLPQIVEGLSSQGFQFRTLSKTSFNVQFIKS